MRTQPFFTSLLVPLLAGTMVQPVASEVVTDFVTVSGTLTLEDCDFDPEVYAIAREPAVRAESSDGLRNTRSEGAILPSPELSVPYAIEIGVNSDPRAFDVAMFARLANGDFIYSPLQTTPNLTSSSPALSGFDVETKTALVTIQFVDEFGTPLTISDGDIHFYTAGTTIHGGIPFLRSAAFSRGLSGSEKTMLVRAGEDLFLRMNASTGSSLYTDLINHHFEFTNLSASGDLSVDETEAAIRFESCSENTVTVQIPTGLVGTVSATVDMVGEIERRAEGAGGHFHGIFVDASHLRVFRNEAHRVALRDGPVHSGDYVARNLLPTTVLGGELYDAQARIALETGGQPELFISPILKDIELDPGENLDLDRLGDPGDVLPDPFVLSRGFLGGTVRFCGPPVREGVPAMLAHLVHPQDLVGDSFREGISNRATLRARNPDGGLALVGYAGAFDAASAAFDGSYQMALGGLHRSTSEWERHGSYFYLLHPDSTSEHWFREHMNITELSPVPHSVADGATITEPVSYDFGEVLVRFRAGDGESFYAPHLRGSGTGVSAGGGTYRVGLTHANGVPSGATDAALEGSVRVLLPAGSYNLTPRVTSQASGGNTDFPRLELDVAPKSFQILDPPLLSPALDLLCYSQDGHLTGRVPSEDSEGNSIEVSAIRFLFRGTEYELDPPAGGWGVSPVFMIDFSEHGISLGSGPEAIVIIADGDDGRQSRLETVVRHDDTPPDINCPKNIVVDADPALDCAAIVTYEVTATDDCPIGMTITCDPPSGHAFPTGTTTVQCTATDALGNTNTCTFTVTVRSTVNIRRAVMVEWSCGVLQMSTNMTDWTDLPKATSPFYAPADEVPRKFYRVRQP